MSYLDEINSLVIKHNLNATLHNPVAVFSTSNYSHTCKVDSIDTKKRYDVLLQWLKDMGLES